ncbi:alpha/beta hydrolase [bacterium]|nr:alpha/beta hydrolase [bacterium]
MSYKDFKFKADEELEIFVASWIPEDSAKIKAVVQLSHGMAEHITRYEGFAKYLNDNGYAVYGNDHRGHGKTAGVMENVGYFSDKDGFKKVVMDMFRLTRIIKEKHPDLPVYLFGHSMGSLLARNYICDFGKELQGVILSGTMGNPGLLGKIGVGVAKLESIFKGRKAKSPMLDKMSFGKFNNAFKPNRTKFDWLSRDNEEVDKYINDPYCGTVFTAGFFVDLLSGLNETFKNSNVEKTPKELPILLFSGEKDPVGNNKKGVEGVYQSYLKAGIQDVTHKFYPQGRHEMLNEINRDEVFADVVSWLNSHLP